MKKVYILIIAMLLATGCDHSPTKSGELYKDAWWKADKPKKGK